MKKVVLFVILALAAIALIVFGSNINQQPNNENGELDPAVIAHIQSKADLIVLNSPEPNVQVRSPLTITGRARGFWYFEASFPITIVDGNGASLGGGIATAQDEWMTENFVPFTSIITFSEPTTGTGTLILHKDNASGLPEHDDELRIPVRFVPSTASEQRMVKLYFYNPEKDKDASGNILCSRAGLEPVDRAIPITQTPLQDTIKLLLRGEITPGERARGITTEFPLEGLSLTGASVAGSLLTLSFDDPNNRTSGGSCRVSILSLQIEETAKQFPNILTVRFTPEELFQP